MPDKRGRFLLYSDTSKCATGSALYQVQNRKPKLIAYASKRMPEAAKNYSITELEMCSLAINITSFAHLLKRVDFDTIVDHLAITHTMKSKMELATNRIKRVLEVLSSSSFNLYYINGKGMILSNFLSRQIEDDSNPHEIIPISFNIQEILQESYHSIVTDTYKVQTRAQTKAQANAPTEADTQPIAQKNTPKIVKMPNETERKRGIATPPSGFIRHPLGNIALPPVVVAPSIRPPPKLPNTDKATTSPGLGPDPSMDIEENSPHQEGIITET